MKEEQNNPAPAERAQPGVVEPAHAQPVSGGNNNEPHWSHGDRCDTDEMDAINSDEGGHANGFREKNRRRFPLHFRPGRAGPARAAGSFFCARSRKR